MSDVLEPVIGQIGPSMEQEFAAQVISGRRRVEGATRGEVFPSDHEEVEGGLTWDMHGVTVTHDGKVTWFPYQRIDFIRIEAGS